MYYIEAPEISTHTYLKKALLFELVLLIVFVILKLVCDCLLECEYIAKIIHLRAVMLC